MNAKHLILLAVCGLVAMVAVRLFQRRAAARKAPDVNSVMPLLAAEAVEFARVRGATLDYTPESVQHVESILATLHQSRNAGQLADKDVHHHACRFGAYIGEVLRRRYGGRWAEDHEVAGKGSFPIHWKDHQSFPIGWCGKRILNGEEDNVWHKFQVVTSDGPLRDALIIPPR